MKGKEVTATATTQNTRALMSLIQLAILLSGCTVTCSAWESSKTLSSFSWTNCSPAVNVFHIFSQSAPDSNFTLRWAVIYGRKFNFA